VRRKYAKILETMGEIGGLNDIMFVFMAYIYFYYN
jgi:hypothetical protein